MGDKNSGPSPLAKNQLLDDEQLEQAAGGGRALRPTIHIYTVMPGDTLELIAKRFRSTVEILSRTNRIQDRHTISVGQKLTIHCR